ncbi:MAG: CHASE domain-containing protein [Myxococcales bacterium]
MDEPCLWTRAAYVGAYMARAPGIERYFAAFEREMLALGGRPHWGRALRQRIPPPRPRRTIVPRVRSSMAPWAALAGSLALTLAAAAFLFSTAQARDGSRFARAVRSAEDRIASRLDDQAALLRGVAGLIAARPDTTAAEFQAFVGRLQVAAHHPGIQGIGFARRVRRAQSGAVEADLQSRGFAGLRIWPDLGREERSAVVWLEPLDARNRAAVGYDMFTNPVRREAMERARDSGMAALSGKVTLVQEIDPRRQPGFLLYVPVYRGGGIPASVEERRETLLGWAYSAFRGDDFFNALFAAEIDPTVDFSIYDGDAVDPDRLLHEARRGAPGRRALNETVRMQPAGRAWTLLFAALPALESGLTAALGVLIIGAAVSALVFLLSRREVLARSRAEHALDELKRSLEERSQFEERLREEGRVNSILRRLGISLAAELDPDRVAQLVVDEGAALTGAERGAMFDGGAAHRLLAVAGGERTIALQPGSELVARTFRGERAVRVADVETPFSAEPVKACLAAAVVSRTGDVLAGLFFAHPAPGHFTEQHERLLLGLAAQASIALDNARLLRDLREADRRKDEFLAVLGHELRNPLAPIVTALEVAGRDPSSAARQLGIIGRQARHMVRIVDDLLDVSRISRGKIELRKQPLSVNDALERAAETVSPLAHARRQKLIVTRPREPLSIEADPVRLEQILGNLLTNAIKYTPEQGEIELSAAERDGELELRVSDTGIGIASDALRTLFDPFVQVAGAKDYATGGLGIGLALVRGLVELHGGTVRAQSAGAGSGSTFTVRLPGVSSGATPREVRKMQQHANRGRVLVVDDNVDAALTLAEAVRLDGHDVRVSHDGDAALKDAASFAPEVVLLDIGLPGMDGYEVVARLRRMPELKRTLMVALTGFGQESDRVRALAAGFDEHLVKPVDLDVVHGVLRRRLG